nr:verprolin-like [Aegilops tauschii subsp. strangulata]
MAEIAQYLFITQGPARPTGKKTNRPDVAAPPARDQRGNRAVNAAAAHRLPRVAPVPIHPPPDRACRTPPSASSPPAARHRLPAPRLPRLSPTGNRAVNAAAAHRLPHGAPPSLSTLLQTRLPHAAVCRLPQATACRLLACRASHLPSLMPLPAPAPAPAPRPPAIKSTPVAPALPTPPVHLTPLSPPPLRHLHRPAKMASSDSDSDGATEDLFRFGLFVPPAAKVPRPWRISADGYPTQGPLVTNAELSAHPGGRFNRRNRRRFWRGKRFNDVIGAFKRAARGLPVGDRTHVTSRPASVLGHFHWENPKKCIKRRKKYANWRGCCRR